jgi:hypothetical protein
MTDSTTEQIYCDYWKLARFRIAPREMIIGQYVKATYNLLKEAREYLNIKINSENQNRACRCVKCNPDTSNKE